MRYRFTVARGWFNPNSILNANLDPNPNSNPNPFLSFPQKGDLHLFQHIFKIDTIHLFGGETVFPGQCFYSAMNVAKSPQDFSQWFVFIRSKNRTRQYYRADQSLLPDIRTFLYCQLTIFESRNCMNSWMLANDVLSKKLWLWLKNFFTLMIGAK